MKYIDQIITAFCIAAVLPVLWIWFVSPHEYIYLSDLIALIIRIFILLAAFILFKKYFKIKLSKTVRIVLLVIGSLATLYLIIEYISFLLK